MQRLDHHHDQTKSKILFIEKSAALTDECFMMSKWHDCNKEGNYFNHAMLFRIMSIMSRSWTKN